MTDAPHDHDDPLVTVVVTTYNRPEYLKQAVQTVEAQEYRPIELIVVDDCSQTPADEVLADVSLDVDRFEIRRHDVNQGANAARNTGVSAATGEYIAFLDDDDQWAPEKLARQIETFRNGGPELGFVYTGRKIVDGEEVYGIVIPDRVEGDMTKALLCENVVGTQSSVMVRADIAKETPFDERIPRWADLEWYVSVSTKCEFEPIREPLVIYELDSHNRISDNYDNLLESYRLFTDKYRDLASEYGWLSERKMLGFAAFRVGSATIDNGSYDIARRHFLKAIAWFPFEPKFYVYAAATLGGRVTHRMAQLVKRALAKTPLSFG